MDVVRGGVCNLVWKIVLSKDLRVRYVLGRLQVDLACQQYVVLILHDMHISVTLNLTLSMYSILDILGFVTRVSVVATHTCLM